MDIQTNIPPPKGINKGLTPALKKMNVGDSILAKMPNGSHNIAKRLGIRVVTRKTDQPYECRIWRIA